MNKRNYFSPELRTASIVPRWSVVWTLNRDTVTNHSFYVGVYAYMVAETIDWQGNRGDLLFTALAHDLDETITGDIVSPIKAEILDDDRYHSFIDTMMEKRMPGVVKVLDDIYERDNSTDIERIITVADRLDALIFLRIEERMGNRHISARLPSALARLESAWLLLPAFKPTDITHDVDRLHELWQTVMLPVIEEHGKFGGYGV